MHSLQSNTGVFTRETLPELLLNIAATEQSGQCVFQTNQHQAVLVFLARQVVAANTVNAPLLRAENAILELLTWLSGNYYFQPEQVFLARIPRENRVRESLNRLLHVTPVPSTQIESVSSVTEMTSVSSITEIASVSSGTQSFEPANPSPLNNVDLMPQQFRIELEKICNTHLGPVGKLILQDAAETCSIDLDFIPRADIQRLLVALQLEIPEAQKMAFRESLKKLRH
jgi:hypothetical protein